MIEVKLNVVKDFDVKASVERAYEVLADVPFSVSHYPDVASLVDQGEGVYAWTLEEIGTRGFNHQVVYACCYHKDPDAFVVSWAPVEGFGNGVVSGSWSVRGRKDGSTITFKTDASLKLDVPKLLKSVAAPFAKKAFEVQIARYLKNLQKTLNAAQSLH